MSKFKYLPLFTLFLLFNIMPALSQRTTDIHGIVRDSITEEVLPYVSVYLKGTTTGSMTNDKGEFRIKTKSANNILIVSSVGYKEKSQTIRVGQSNELRIMLAQASYELSDIIVKPKKEKYSRKDNPAVDFVKKVIDSRDKNDPRNQEYYKYEQYEKMTFALNDFSDKQKKMWLFKKFDFIFNYVDTSEISGKPILTVSIKEIIEDNYYRKSPRSEKKVVKGIKRAGIDEFLSQDGVQKFLEEVFKEVNIFDNNIPLFLNRFVSPLSTIGPSFYKYYLIDTVMINNTKCMDLGFVPFNSQSFGFTGHLFITLDSTNFVKRVKLNVPNDINLNFVEHMYIEQEFDRTPQGIRLMTRDDIIVEFKIAPNTQGLHARKTCTYRDHSFTPPENMALFNENATVIEESDARTKTDLYWTHYRHEPIKSKENAVETMMKKLREVPVFYYTEKVISILISGYIQTAKEGSKIDIGPMNTTISGNGVEGARLRVGGMTTAYLNKNLFGKGYVAYGTKDGRFKYSAELEYSFDKKKEYANEFPIHSIKAQYTYDINQLGQQYLYTNKDNIFLSLKRKKDDRITYLRKAEVSYLREHYSGLSYGAEIRHRTEYPTSYVSFNKIGADGIVRPVSSYNMSEVEVKIRYAPNEKFYQTRGNRYPITLDAPIFSVSHTYAHKGILGTDYNYNRTEIGFQKRIWFSAFGYTDVIVKAGKVWDKVPFPMLLIPNANLSYTIQPESYTLMNAMEFLNDQYASWDLTYYMNGLLLNRIPLIKYLKWREVLSFRGLYGNLTKKNNPDTGGEGLYLFPVNSGIMNNVPYMEAGIGIENIFKILRVDYVWRLTYRDRPDISKSGLRISLKFAF